MQTKQLSSFLKARAVARAFLIIAAYPARRQN